MKCSKPFRSFGCGQCMPCRINKKRLWIHRMMLELYDHSAAWFVTLTYSEASLPSDGSVSVRAMQLFLKRLRRDWHGKIRYYLVGEYGAGGLRPHYHAIIYGGPEDINAATALFQKCWPHGFVKVGDVTPASAGYVCGYLMKAVAAPPGCRQPFARMSKRPGIGCGQVVEKTAAFYSSPVGARTLAGAGDVTGALRTDGKIQPLGRYLKSKIRQSLGLDPGEPQAAAAARGLAIQAVVSEIGTKAYLRAEEEKRDQSAHAARARLSIAESRKML